MKAIRIDNDLIQSHPYWVNYHSTLSEVAQKDYVGKNFFQAKEINCIDTDAVELGQHKGKGGNQDNTTDAAISISAMQNAKGNNNVKQLLLVELRMDYDSVNNVKFSDWKRKVNHTVQLMTGLIPISDTYVFVFNDSLAPVVISKLEGNKKSDAELRKYVVKTVREFENCCLLPKDWPAVLDFDLELLKSDAKKIFQSQSEDSMVDFASYWYDRMAKYSLQHKIDEVDAVNQVFVSLIDCFHNSLSEDVENFLKEYFN